MPSNRELWIWKSLPVVYRLFLYLNFSFLEYQVLAHHSLPYILNILYDSLEVGGSVIRASDEDLFTFARSCRCVQWRNLDESEDTVKVIRLSKDIGKY
jgi:hypothetical protein